MERQTDRKTGFTVDDRARDPETLSFIERISWFERQGSIANDNAEEREADSACFESWALPEFMRK